MIESNDKKILFDGVSFNLSNPSGHVVALGGGNRVVSRVPKGIDSMGRVSTQIDCNQAPKAEFGKLER